MKPTVAFDVCQEIYAAARELVDSRLPTMRLDSAAKFLWRPDRRPRLVEYVADFAMAGERALADPATRHAGSRLQSPCRSRDGARCCDGGSADCESCKGERGGPGASSSSRLILFRMHYLGGAEYQAARRLLGLSELTWSDWTEDIRTRVGRELLRSGMFPPSRYFREPTKK